MPPHVLAIRPSRGWVPLRLGELWAYRELLYFMVWRDVKVRYKQAVLGILWAVLQPFLMMVVFSLFFGRLTNMPSEGLPYPVFTYCALLPWQLFSRALMESGNSLVSSQNLITKVYFPRLIMPIASVLASLVDFGFAFSVLIGLMVCYGVVPSAAIWTLPFFTIAAVTTALAAGLWLSALNVHYRDVRHAIPFLVQFWFFLSPVVYPSSLIPASWRLVYAMNPMVGVVEGFRWALLGKAHAPGLTACISVAVMVIGLVGGLYYFRRMESTFADVV